MLKYSVKTNFSISNSNTQESIATSSVVCKLEKESSSNQGNFSLQDFTAAVARKNVAGGVIVVSLSSFQSTFSLRREAENK